MVLRCPWVGLEDDMALRHELVQEFSAGRDPREAFTADGLPDELKEVLAGRMLSAELDQHLASGRAGAPGEADGSRDYRDASSRKTVLSETGKLELQVARERQASFGPRLIARRRRRFPGFDDKAVSPCARGMTVRGIRGRVRELCDPPWFSWISRALRGSCRHQNPPSQQVEAGPACTSGDLI